jgi:hypothetical protein
MSASTREATESLRYANAGFGPRTDEHDDHYEQ